MSSLSEKQYNTGSAPNNERSGDANRELRKKEERPAHWDALKQTRPQDVLEPTLPDLVEARRPREDRVEAADAESVRRNEAAGTKTPARKAAKSTVERLTETRAELEAFTAAMDSVAAEPKAAEKAGPAEMGKLESAVSDAAELNWDELEQFEPDIPTLDEQIELVASKIGDTVVPKRPAAAAPAPQSAAVPKQTAAAAPPQSAAVPKQTAAAAPASKPAVVPEQISKPASKNIVKFGLEPVLPYSIEEAINRLRINISFLGSDVKKIMIISSEPNEGKSFIALNLWKQMALAGEPSILVDIDMRKSVMVTKYQMKREDGQELKGTSHFLSGDGAIENTILHTKDQYGDILPNVDNIVNPSMLLESRRFNEMLQYMEEHYRYVFIDAPPLGLVSDGELIGNVCDGAVLCVRGGVTSRNIVRRSIRQLERAGCPVLGIVLNRVGGAGSTYYHKYYGKKYYGYGRKYYYNDQYYSKG